MIRKTPLLPEVEAEVISSLPDIDALYRTVSKRRLVYNMPLHSGDHMALAWVCLNDLAEMVQIATVALREAKLDWHWVLANYENNLFQAVNAARYSFDYAALLMSAASNHLASAMWHFHEEEKTPLGKRYKSAAQVVNAWKERPSKPASLALLKDLLEFPDWKAISEYRDEWVHRGMPVIRGELKYARREIWRDADALAPNHYALKVSRPDGKVTYDTLNLVPDHDMQDLFDAATAALFKLNDMSVKFLDLFDQPLLESGR